MTVFRETLRRGWRGMLLWGVGFALIALAQSSVLGDVDALKEFGEVMASMPPFLMQMIGTTDLAFMGTPEGFLAGKFYASIVIVFAVYGVMSGLNVTAVEEDRGILNVLMSAPLPRWRLVVEKFAAFALLLLGVVLITDLGLMIGILTSPASATINTGRLFTVTLGLYPLGLITMAFTAMIGALISNRSRATGIAFGFVVVSYFINFMGGAATDSIMGSLAGVSFFYYFDAVESMKNGLALGGVLVLIVVSVALVGVGMFAFQRRDIAV